jgi:hypothetical protein
MTAAVPLIDAAPHVLEAVVADWRLFRIDSSVFASEILRHAALTLILLPNRQLFAINGAAAYHVVASIFVDEKPLAVFASRIA